MDLDKKTLLTAGVALVVGLILGGARGGEDMNEKIAAAIQGAGAPVAEVAGSVDGLKGDIAALNDRVALLEEAVAASGAAAVAASLGEGEAVRAAVAEVGAAVGGIATTMAERHKMMDERHKQMMEHRAQMHAQMQAHAAAPAAAAAAAPAAEAAASAAPAPEPEAAPEGFRVGQTAMFEEGALRVFVGKVNAETGTVRVAINGLAQTEIDLFGGAARVDVNGKSCRVGLGAIDRGHAAITAECS